MKGMEKSYGVVIEERAVTGRGGGVAVVVGGDERRVKKKIGMSWTWKDKVKKICYGVFFFKF